MAAIMADSATALTQVNKKTIKDLELAFSSDTAYTTRGLEASPIVVDGTADMTGSCERGRCSRCQNRRRSLVSMDPEVLGDWARTAMLRCRQSRCRGL